MSPAEIPNPIDRPFEGDSSPKTGEDITKSEFPPGRHEIQIPNLQLLENMTGMPIKVDMYSSGQIGSQQQLIINTPRYVTLSQGAGGKHIKIDESPKGVSVPTVQPRSVYIGGDAFGNTIVTGSNNVITGTPTKPVQRNSSENIKLVIDPTRRQELNIKSPNSSVVIDVEPPRNISGVRKLSISASKIKINPLNPNIPLPGQHGDIQFYELNVIGKQVIIGPGVKVTELNVTIKDDDGDKDESRGHILATDNNHPVSIGNFALRLDNNTRFKLTGIFDNHKASLEIDNLQITGPDEPFNESVVIDDARIKAGSIENVPLLVIASKSVKDLGIIEIEAHLPSRFDIRSLLAQGFRIDAKRSTPYKTVLVNAHGNAGKLTIKMPPEGQLQFFDNKST